MKKTKTQPPWEKQLDKKVRAVRMGTDWIDPKNERTASMKPIGELPTSQVCFERDELIAFIRHLLICVIGKDDIHEDLEGGSWERGRNRLRAEQRKRAGLETNNETRQSQKKSQKRVANRSRRVAGLK